MSNQYAQRDHRALGEHYLRHVSAMTGEGLHAKSDIAAELAWRDAEIERLRTAIKQHVAEAVAKETERLRGALLTLANAADDVGVQFFDMEDPPISVAQMESATLAARTAIKQHVAEAVTRETERCADAAREWEDNYVIEDSAPRHVDDAIRARADNEVTK